MTKKVIVVASLVLVAAFYMNKSVKSNMVFDLAIANIDAMSQDEAGTPVSECYVYNSSEISYAHRVACDDRTTSDMIYSCPTVGTSFNCYTKLTLCKK